MRTRPACAQSHSQINTYSVTTKCSGDLVWLIAILLTRQLDWRRELKGFRFQACQFDLKYNFHEHEEEKTISLIVLVSFWEANTPHLLVLYQMALIAPTGGEGTSRGSDIES